MDDGAGASHGEDSPPPSPPPPATAPEKRYKGVRLRKWGRWVSEIRMPNSRERVWLGSYESAEKAARAFDAAAVCLRGPRAGSLNFPESPPNVRHIPGALLTPEQIQAEAVRHANDLPAGPAAAATTAAPGEAAAAERRTNDLSGSIGTSGAALCAGDDALDWSFMDAMPASTMGTNAAMDDFMIGSPYPAMPPSEGTTAADVVDDDGEHTFISDDLWRF
ncbi:hypothetical protein ACP70R_014825 [Stipagrostis hirtigluma subsp. patula]